MRIGTVCVVLLALAYGAARASEPVCYRTAEAAAMQIGVRGVDGFRLEGRERDVFSGVIWATVKSCTHPERPGVLMMATGAPGRAGVKATSEPAAMVLKAGTKVTLIETDGLVRIEMPGVAQGSGSVGDRIQIRLLTLSGEGSERFVHAIVRGGDVVEGVTR